MDNEVKSVDTKIVLISSSSDAVGVSTHVYNLAKLLHTVKMIDVVVCPDVGWLTNKLEDSRIPYTVMKMTPRPKDFVSATSSMLRFLRSKKRDTSIIHLHGRCPLFLSLFPILLFPDFPIVVTVHQFTTAGKPGAYAWKTMMETLLLRRVKRICCVSEGLRKETVSRIGFAKSSCVQVIPNWIEPYWYQKNSNNVEYRCVVDGKQIRICGVGRLVREKGFDILVESISILRSKGYDVTCDIYGDGPEAEVLNKQIIDIGVSRSVILKGIKEAVRMSLPSYDVLVIPSRSESFGITALEAFDASVPVVASDIEGLRELVVDRYSGLSFMPDDPRSLANALRELLLSENLRQSLISNGHQVLNKYLPCKAFLDSYREFYAQALKT